MTMDGRRQRRWRNLLIDRRFQLEHTAKIVGVTALISVVLGAALVSAIRESSRMLRLEAELDEAFAAQLAGADAELTALVIGGLVAFNLAIALVAVLVTHRMAGPAFVLRRYLHELGAGRLPEVRPLRSGDELVELADALRTAIRALEARARQELDVLDRAEGLLSAEGGPGAARVRQELAGLAAEKRALLGLRPGPVGGGPDAGPPEGPDLGSNSY